MPAPEEGKIAFLCSGGGGTLRFIHRLILQSGLPGWRVAAVLVDRPCPALDYARQSRIPGDFVRYSRTHPEALRTALFDAGPDVIVTNIHKIIDPETVRLFAGRLLNLHYSLLPAFPGLIGDATILAARAQGCRFTGATCHLVTPDVDAGPILAQAAVPIRSEEPDTTLVDRVFRAGCVTLANTLSRWRSAPTQGAGIMTIWEETAFSPEIGFDTGLLSNEFWRSLR